MGSGGGAGAGGGDPPREQSREEIERGSLEVLETMRSYMELHTEAHREWTEELCAERARREEQRAAQAAYGEKQVMPPMRSEHTRTHAHTHARMSA